MFCAPSARPDQNGPAISATDVYARPLSATVTTAAAMRMTAAATDPSADATPIRSMTATAATDTQRSGTRWLPTRSLRTPIPMRPTAPANWLTPITMPAAREVKCSSVTSQTRPKVDTVNWGTTSSIETAWMRHSSDVSR